MTHGELRALCLSQKEATSDFPFDAITEVFRIRGKMFALCDGGRIPLTVNLKADPLLSPDLRAHYPEITPGWHMNKEHWNSVRLDGNLEREKIQWLVAHSWERVARGLSKRERESLGLDA